MTLHWILILYIFLGFVGLIAILTAVNLYHLFRFGFLSAGFIVMGILAVLVPAAILLSVFRTVAFVDWGTEINFSLPSVQVQPNLNDLP
jgi:hypothetical protein